MWIYAWNKQLKEAYIGSTPVKEIYLWNTKVRPEGPKYNLDLNNGQPIWRLHDWELWFRVNVKDASEPFKIAVNGSGSTSYDWDISIDGAEPIRKTGNRSTASIQLSMTIGKHYVKITPHNGVAAGWAKCMGSNNHDVCHWNNDRNKLEFWLERLPWYAFMESETSVGNFFLSLAWKLCTSLTSMPNWFGFPQGITSVGARFLSSTWTLCTSLTSIPSWFNLPQGITSVDDGFLSNTWASCTSLTSIPSWFNIPQGLTSIRNVALYWTWFNCKSLTSDLPAEPLNFPNVSWPNYASNCFWGSCPISPDTPTPWSSVMVHRS